MPALSVGRRLPLALSLPLPLARVLLLLTLAVGLIAAACSDDAPPQAQQTQQAQQAQQQDNTARAFEGVPGIVDPTNLGWPRDVEGLNGIVTIPAKPQRIVTLSVGHDEMTLAIVPNQRLVAVGSSTKNETYSNVSDHVQDKDEATRDPEVIIAASPDVVVTSPFMAAEVVDAVHRAGIPIIQTELTQGPQPRLDAILLMGYIYGEEERAIAFEQEVRERFEAVTAATAPLQPKPRVLALTSYSDTLWVAGRDSTEGGVILAAGGLNAADEEGIVGNATISLEGLIAISPDIIIIPQPIDFGAEDFRQSLLDNEALAELPAIANAEVHVVTSKHFTTLSFWNIRGVEELAHLLWPDQIAEPAGASFSFPQ